MPRGLGFRGSEKAPLSFVEMRQDRRVALLERIFIDHPQNYDAPRRQGIPSHAVKPNPIQLLSDGPLAPTSRNALPFLSIDGTGAWRLLATIRSGSHRCLR